jgi:hypothetical protein
MKLLLRVYPRRWRERYGNELLSLLEAEPLTWRVAANVLRSGLGERLRGSDSAPLRVLWAWSLFVIGGTAFQKAAEHWQVVVPGADRAVPTAAFNTAEVAAAIGSAAVLAAVALAFPAFVRDLRSGGWTALRRPIVIASAVTAVAAGAIVAVALNHDVIAASIFITSGVGSLFAWTRAATLAARRLPPLRVHRHLALTVTVTMVVITIAAAVWFASVTAHAPSFVGVEQLAVIAMFMAAGLAVAATGARVEGRGPAA